MDQKRLVRESENVDIYITDCYLRNENISEMYNFIGNIIELQDFLILNEKSIDYIRFFDNSFDLLYFKTLNIKGSLILLDATFEPELNKVFFPKDTNFEIVTMKEVFSMDQKIYQFKGNKRFAYPLNTLYRNEHYTSSFEFLYKLTNMIVKKHVDDGVFIVSRKKFGIKDELEKRIKIENIDNKDNVLFGNFGGLRGLNKYKNCDTCIIFGTPFPNSNYVSRLSNVLGVNSKIIDKSMKEDEIIQDIFRIRPLQKESNIYVLSSVKVFENDTDVMYMTPNEMLKMLDKKLLTNNSSYGRIYGDINNLMSNEITIKKVDIFRRIKGDDKLIREVIKDLINSDIIKEELMKRGKRGRPISYLRLI